MREDVLFGFSLGFLVGIYKFLLTRLDDDDHCNR
jgi:hypothetical protein